MNLKEGFRFQNKLQELLSDTEEILGNEKNVVQVKTTYLRKKVSAEAEDETVLEKPPTEYADRITELVDFMVWLLKEKEALSAAIREAKRNAPIDIDCEVGLNASRQSAAATLTRMIGIRSSEVTVSGGGYGYRFNAEGNQISYKCDVKKVTTIHFDRNRVLAHVRRLTKQIDAVSMDIDRCIVNTDIAYAPPFDVNAPFIEVFEDYLSRR